MPSKEFQIRITADATSFAAPVQQAVSTLNTAAVNTQRQGVLLGEHLSMGMMRGFRLHVRHWMHAGMFVAGILGAAFGQQIDKSFTGALRGAMHGAIAGGLTGAMFGGPGLLIGAGVGAITGAIAHHMEQAVKITREMQKAAREATKGLSTGTIDSRTRGSLLFGLTGKGLRGMNPAENVDRILKEGGQEAVRLAGIIDKQFGGDAAAFKKALSIPLKSTNLETLIDKSRKVAEIEQQIAEWQKEQHQALEDFNKARDESLTTSEKLLQTQKRLNEAVEDLPWLANDESSWLNRMTEALNLQRQMNESAKVSFPSPGNFARAGLFLTGGSVPPQISQAMSIMQQIVSRINAVVDAQRKTTTAIEKQ